MRSALVVASMLLGCNGLLGLDSTRVEDLDGDGVVDVLDNCPDKINPDQLDTDEDAVGDACDTCIGCQLCDRGPQHDEDGDTFADDCDNCPTIPNLDQANADGDDLGDLCDADNASQQDRVLFDGFGTLDDSRWEQTAGDWVIVDDAVVATDGPDDVGRRLVLRDTPLDGATRWTFETVFDVPVAPMIPDQLGGYVETATGFRQWGCLIGYHEDTWEALNGLPVPIVLSGGMSLKIIMSSQASASDRVCEIVSVGEFKNQLPTEAYPLAVELFTRTRTHFDYVEIIK